MSCGFRGLCTSCPYEYCIEEDKKIEKEKGENSRKKSHMKKKQEGICIKCPNPAREGRTLCERCAQKQVEANRRYTLKRMKLSKGIEE